MAIVYQNAWINSTPASSLSIATATTAGRTLIAWIVDDIGTAADTVNWPAGFVAGAVQQTTADGQTLSWAYKPSASGSEGTLAISLASSNTIIGGIAEFSGVDTGTPLDVTVPAAANNSALMASPWTITNAITPVTPGAMLLALMGSDSLGANDTAHSFSDTAGLTWTTIADQNSTFWNVALAAATMASPAATTITGTGTFAGDSAGRALFVLALRPAGAAAPGMLGIGRRSVTSLMRDLTTAKGRPLLTDTGAVLRMGVSPPLGAASLAPISGNGDATLGAVTGSAAGAVAVAGAQASTLDAVTGAASGAVAITGSAAATLDAVTGAASGTVGAPVITGTSAITLGSVTGTASGTVAIAGAAAVTLGAVIGAAAGTVAITGSQARTLGAVSGAAAGAVAVTGSAAATLGAVTGSAAGKVAVAGSASATLDQVVGAGAGAVAVRGTSAATLGAVTGQATGTVADPYIYVPAEKALHSPDRGTHLKSPDRGTHLKSPSRAVHLASPARATHLRSPDRAVHYKSPARGTHLKSPKRDT